MILKLINILRQVAGVREKEADLYSIKSKKIKSIVKYIVKNYFVTAGGYILYINVHEGL